MAFHVRHPETDRVVRKLASVKGASLTEAIRKPCEKSLSETSGATVRERRLSAVAAVQDRLGSYPDNPDVVIDKAFWDSLIDE